MFKKSLLIALSIPLFLNAASITSLLHALQYRPESQLDNLEIEKSKLSKESVSDQLMPTVNIYGGYEISNIPRGVVTVVPNKLIGMVQDPNIGQPFSKGIAREGVNFTWPLFIKSVYTLEEKAELLNLSAKEKKKLNLIQREAIVVGSVAQLKYLESLKDALKAKKHSIVQTQIRTRLEIKEERAPQSADFILESNINDVDIAINNIDQNINLISSKIETLTGIYLKHSVPLTVKRSVITDEIMALKPLKKNVEAKQKGIQAAKEAFIPSIVTKGNYTYSQADAYNNGKPITEQYGTLGVYLSMPLFDASKNTAIEQAKVDYLKEKTNLNQAQHALEVQAKQLQREIILLKKSITLAKKSVSDQKELLKIAKVSYENERITQEEYLRYEDALANSKANLYNIHAKQWQDIAQLAVIYGNDLEEIVK